MSATIKHQLKERLGYQFVEEGYTLPIMRDERLARFVTGPAYVWLNSLIEYALTPIYIGYRTNPFSITTRTADGNDIKVEGSIGYIFNPELAHADIQFQIAKAATKSQQPFKEILRDAIGPAIREFVAKKMVLEMATGEVQAMLEAHIRYSVREPLRPYGLQLAELQENGQSVGVKALKVKQIHLPESVNTLVSMGQLAVNTANLLQLPIELVTRLIFDLKKVEQASINGNLVLVSPESTLNPQLLQLLNQAKGQHTIGSNGHSDEIIHRRYPSSSNNSH